MNIFLYHYWYDKRFEKRPGGPVRFWEFANALVKEGHRVILFSPKSGLPRQQTSAEVVEIPAVGIPIIGILFYEMLLFAASLFTLLRVRCDLVHVRLMTSLVPYVISFVLRKPMVLDIFDDPFFRYEHTSGLNRIKLPLVRFCDRKNIMHANTLIVSTDKVRNALIENMDVSPSRFLLAPFGSNTATFRPYDKTDVRKLLHLDPALQYIGFVGIYREGNDFDSLVESAKIVTKQLPHVRYIVVGDDRWKDLLLPKIENAGIRDFFLIYAYVLYDDVPKYISALDICLAPFTRSWGDTAAIKIYDYLSCGRPVITTKLGSTAKYLEQSKAVLFGPPEDPEMLARTTIGLLTDPQKMEEMGRHGRDFILTTYNRDTIYRTIIKSISRLNHRGSH
jgi:glycosyltransferase involved in cell wall biosynthesis